MKLSDYLPLEPGEVRILVYKYHGEYFGILQTTRVNLHVPQEMLGAEVVFAVRRKINTREDKFALIKQVEEEGKRIGIENINYLQDFGE
ncbi:MAG: hypothetical protein M1383_05125 [Patescibacteria group bacterium]|nr:hypothetical protein [Patescibacteria group bacterium]